MRVRVIGVKRIQGIAKASGEPFDMCNVSCLVPISSTKGAKFSVQGHGLEIAEIACDPACLDQFMGLPFPVEMELSIEQRFNRGEFQSVCVGVVAQAAKLKTA